MSASNCDGPSLANVRKVRNCNYYPINGLLDELDMKDKGERKEFKGLCNEYSSWNDEKKAGYKTDEHIVIPDGKLPYFAKQFIDECGIILPTAGAQDSKPGLYYFPGRDSGMGSICNPHVKKWIILSIARASSR